MWILKVQSKLNRNRKAKQNFSFSEPTLILLPIETVAACRTSTDFCSAHQNPNTKLIGGIIKKKILLPVGKTLCSRCIHTSQTPLSPKWVQLTLTQFTMRIILLYVNDSWFLMLQQSTTEALAVPDSNNHIPLKQGILGTGFIFLRSHRYC